jgi:hypothetical protein
MLPGKVMSPRASSGGFGVSHPVDRGGGCGDGACGAVGDAEGSSIRSTGLAVVSEAALPRMISRAEFARHALTARCTVRNCVALKRSGICPRSRARLVPVHKVLFLRSESRALGQTSDRLGRGGAVAWRAAG